MPNDKALGISFKDVWIEHRHGRIFARVWNSLNDPSKPVPGSPIVLFHDSLGCVELWRNFPAELSASTGRRVVAYDRLGFGRSDSRGDKLALDFVADEARTYFSAIGEQVGFKRFIAFGHSVGGGMAVIADTYHVPHREREEAIVHLVTEFVASVQ
jgi:pimeloyl-ACP methyl ester carboxylesterase